MQKLLKKQNGFTGADVLIAIGIIALFTGLITTIVYNIFLASNSVKRISTANSYIVNIFEQVDKMIYDEVTPESLATYFNSNHDVKVAVANNDNAISIYKVDIKVESYQTTTNINPQIDLLKIVDVKVSYKIGTKNQVLEMNRIKKREMLTSPNKPDLEILKNNLSLAETKKIYAVQYVNNKYKVCDLKDIQWYNYDNGIWALTLIPNNSSNELTIGQTINKSELEEYGEIYVWIPRYAYSTGDTTQVTFIYGLSNNYINTGIGYQVLTPVDENMNSNLFGTGEAGKWLSDTASNRNLEPYKTLNNSSKYQRKNI